MNDRFIFTVRRRNRVFHAVPDALQGGLKRLWTCQENQRLDPDNILDLANPLFAGDVSCNTRHLQKSRSRKKPFVVHLVIDRIKCGIRQRRAETDFLQGRGVVANQRMQLSVGYRPPFRNRSVRNPVSFPRKRIGWQADPARSRLVIETLPFYVFACCPHGSEFAQVPLSQSLLCNLRGAGGAPPRAKAASVDIGRRLSLAPPAQPI